MDFLYGQVRIKVAPSPVKLWTVRYGEIGSWLSIVVAVCFTPKSDQLQFSLSVSRQRYIIQYGEFGNR